MEPQEPQAANPPPLHEPPKFAGPFALAFFAPFFVMAITFLIMHENPKAEWLFWIPLAASVIGVARCSMLLAQKLSTTGLGWGIIFVVSFGVLSIVYLVSLIAGCASAVSVNFH